MIFVLPFGFLYFQIHVTEKYSTVSDVLSVFSGSGVWCHIKCSNRFLWNIFFAISAKYFSFCLRYKKALKVAEAKARQWQQMPSGHRRVASVGFHRRPLSSEHIPLSWWWAPTGETFHLTGAHEHHNVDHWIITNTFKSLGQNIIKTYWLFILFI